MSTILEAECTSKSFCYSYFKVSLDCIWYNTAASDVTYNCFQLTGACLLAIGLWIRLDDNIWERVEFFDEADQEPLFEYGAYFLMAIGAFILIFGFLGCCGAIKENSCMLGMVSAPRTLRLFSCCCYFPL